MNAQPIRKSPSRRRPAARRWLRASCSLAALLVLAAGCIPSLHPVYTEDQLVFDENVVGQWDQSNGQSKWNFMKRDDRSYRLVFTDNKGQQGQFVARIASIGDTRLLDLTPEEIQASGDTSGFYKLHLIPIHTIYLLRSVTDSKVQLAAIDYKWLEQYLDQNPSALEFTEINGRLLVTAPTEDVQAFALEHKGMFTGNIELLRR